MKKSLQVWKNGYLHNGGVLPNPLVKGGGKLFKLFKLFLSFSIEKWMTRGWFGENVIQLGHVRDDRLLIRFGGINI